MKSKTRRCFLGGAVSVLIVFGVQFYPALRIQEVQIQGLNFLDNQRVNAYMEDTYTGQPFFKLLMPSFFLKNIKQQFKTVESVSLHLQKRLKILFIFEEKTPWVSFLLESKSVIISDDGTILSVGDDHHLFSTDSMLIFRGFSEFFFDNDSISMDLLNRIRLIKDTIDQYDLGVDLQVEYLKDNQWGLLMGDTIPVYLGELDDVGTKFNYLNRFLSYYHHQDKKRSLKQLDLRVKDKVLVTYGK